jgi:hypothetical protein
VIDDIKRETNQRMGKSLEALGHAFGRIRTGRANPAILEGIQVSYYGVDTPLNQVASINVEDARTLLITPWDKKLLSDIEKAILKSDLGITPASNAESIRIPLPPLSEEKPPRSGPAGKAGGGTGPRGDSQYPARRDRRRTRLSQRERDLRRRRASCGGGHPTADRQADIGNRSRFIGKRSRFIKDLTLRSRH